MLVDPSFSLANSLISADVLSVHFAGTLQKLITSKLLLKLVFL